PPRQLLQRRRRRRGQPPHTLPVTPLPGLRPTIHAQRRRRRPVAQLTLPVRPRRPGVSLDGDGRTGRLRVPRARRSAGSAAPERDVPVSRSHRTISLKKRRTGLPFIPEAEKVSGTPPGSSGPPGRGVLLRSISGSIRRASPPGSRLPAPRRTRSDGWGLADAPAPGPGPAAPPRTASPTTDGRPGG